MTPSPSQNCVSEIFWVTFHDSPHPELFDTLCWLEGCFLLLSTYTWGGLRPMVTCISNELLYAFYFPFFLFLSFPQLKLSYENGHAPFVCQLPSELRLNSELKLPVSRCKLQLPRALLVHRTSFSLSLSLFLSRSHFVLLCSVLLSLPVKTLANPLFNACQWSLRVTWKPGQIDQLSSMWMSDQFTSSLLPSYFQWEIWCSSSSNNNNNTNNSQM